MDRVLSTLACALLSGIIAAAPTRLGYGGGDLTCSIDLSLEGCATVRLGAPVPVYIYPTPWPYETASTNPYLSHLVSWLVERGGGGEARAVDDPEVRPLPVQLRWNNQSWTKGTSRYRTLACSS